MVESGEDRRRGDGFSDGHAAVDALEHATFVSRREVVQRTDLWFREVVHRRWRLVDTTLSEPGRASAHKSWRVGGLHVKQPVLSETPRRWPRQKPQAAGSDWAVERALAVVLTEQPSLE